MATLKSSDGTTIAYTRVGSGPAVIIVDGALCHREMGPSAALAERLAGHFTVYTYDRRGRGESGDRTSYAVEREVEDLAALIAEAGGRASLVGVSSGGVLALEAASRGLPVERLVIYEAPLVVDDTHPPLPQDWVAQLDAHVAAGRRGQAVSQFMLLVGMPRPMLAVMRLLPVWRKLSRVAHTLPYDMKIVGDGQSGAPLRADRWAGATVPALVIAGGKSGTWIKNAARALADVLPAAEHRILEGQNHMIKADALAPVLAAYLNTEQVALAAT